MRLGIVLAATGAAVTAFAVATAQDGSVPRGARPGDTAAARTNQFFSRNGTTSRPAPAKPQPVQGVRNYYTQLFDEPGASPAASATPLRTAGGTDGDSGALINATYDRQAGQRAAGTIQPVGGGRPIFPASASASTAAPTPQRQPVNRPKPAPRATPANPFLQTGQEVEATLPAEEALIENAVGDPGDAPPFELAEPSVEAETAVAEQPEMPEPVEPATEALDVASDLDAPAEPERTASRRPGLTAPLSLAPARDRVQPLRDPLPSTTITPAETVSRLAESHMGGPAAVEVRWEKVSEITVGRECRCELVVRNTGAGAAGEVAVEAFFPPSVRLTDADPKPTSASDRLTWTLPALAAGAERRIAIVLVPSEQGDLQVSASVRYTEAAATTLAVREPRLEVSIDGPSEVAMGEPVSQTITISNPGSGTAENVTVEANLPAGLEHAKGSRLVMPIGSLMPGQSQVVRLALLATQGGPQEVQVAVADGEGTLRREAASSVLVSAPSLKVAAEGPGLRYVGRDAVYRVRVTNDGAAAANNVRVTQAVADGFTFVKADNGGRFESGSGEVVWYVGSLAAGESVDVSCVLTASKLGAHRHLVTVYGDGGTKADSVVETAVDGTASLVCEVIDLDDPVEVGSETAYEIRIRNEGTKEATNVAVACQVPAGVAALSARGPTEPRGENGMLVFPAVGALEPGKTAVYRVIVKGTAEGKHRFRVRLTSDSIDEPLIHEELTHYYAD